MIQCGSNFFSLWIKPCSVTILWKATEQYFHVVLRYSLVCELILVEEQVFGKVQNRESGYFYQLVNKGLKSPHCV